MPAEGGVPKRLDLHGHPRPRRCLRPHGAQQHRHGLEARRQDIVFRSRMHAFNDFIGQLFTVSIDGGLPEQLPLPRGGFCSFSPDGDQAGLQPHLPRVPHLETLPRRHGRRRLDLRLRHQEDRRTSPTNDAQRHHPDVVRRQDLFPLRPRRQQALQPLRLRPRATRQTRQLTTFTDFDIKFPSLGDKAIVFENGGWIYRVRPGHRKGRQGADPHPRRSRRQPHRSEGRQQEHHELRDHPRRQAGPVRCPRRPVHRAGQGRGRRAT